MSIPWWVYAIWTCMGVALLVSVSQRPDVKQLPVPALTVPTPSPGPIEVELQHDAGKFTFRLGGSGHPIVADPGSGRKWILLPVKTEPNK